MKRFICGVAALLVAFSSQSASAADVIQNQWVRANQDGIQGRVVVPRSEGISALRDGTVSLVDERGKHVARDVKSDKTGRFTVPGVKPGVYTLMVTGENAFACCAMHVVSSDVAIQNEFVIAAGAIDYDVVRLAAARYMPTGKPAKTAVDFDPSSNPMMSHESLQDTMHIRRNEGGLKGRLTRAGLSENMGAPQANVLIFRDGVEVARTLTNDAGEFFVPSLPLGSYAVLGSGQHGLVVAGLELVDELAAAAIDSDDASRLVQPPGEISDQFGAQLAPLPGTVITDEVISEQIIDLGVVNDDDNTGVAFFPGGGSVGGGPVGGGGGVGGRGLRGIVPLGLGAAGLAVALADDDDGTITPIASPATP